MYNIRIICTRRAPAKTKGPSVFTETYNADNRLCPSRNDLFTHGMAAGRNEKKQQQQLQQIKTQRDNTSAGKQKRVTTTAGVTIRRWPRSVVYKAYIMPKWWCFSFFFPLVPRGQDRHDEKHIIGRRSARPITVCLRRRRRRAPADVADPGPTDGQRTDTTTPPPRVRGSDLTTCTCFLPGRGRAGKSQARRPSAGRQKN